MVDMGVRLGSKIGIFYRAIDGERFKRQDTGNHIAIEEQWCAV
jgi:hypothetical protein